MFGYAELGEKNAASGTCRQYVASYVGSQNSSESNEDCIGGAHQSATHSTITVFLDGRPRWSDAPHEETTAKSLVEAFLREGAAVFTRLNGGFAIALFDRRKRELTLAIDRMGILSLAWVLDGQRILFSTSPTQLANRPNGAASPRSQAIYEYFFFHMIPSPETVFPNVRKVRASSTVVASRAGVQETRYWTPTFDRLESDPFPVLKERVRAALTEAVRTHYQGPKTGAFLSGGLDSSTVAGYLAASSTEPAQTFSIGFGVESFDELEYARITNRHFGCSGHEYSVTPEDIVNAIPIVASAFDEPFGNSSAIPTYACARLAKSHGMTRLLAGDGGDEIFAGNERYARHQVFELFNRIPASIRKPISQLTQLAIGADSAVTLLRKIRSYVDQASIPLPERYESWNFVYREGANLMFREDFMHDVDVDRPMRQMSELFHSTPSTDLIDQMLYYDWKYTLADNDLRKVTAMCDVAGIEVAFPMLDNRVIEVSTAIPSNLKMERMELRTFFKRAMEGFLPDAVLKKTKHGFGLPFGQWLKTHPPLAEMVYGSLTDLKQRAIVRSSFIDKLIEDHRLGHASYYGYVIWDLVILEEWFKHQATRADTIAHTFSRGA